MNNENNLNQLALIEQSLQQFNIQKQQYQLQLNEIENALKEIEGKDFAYKIIGSLMIKKNTASLKKELKEQKEMMELKINSIEKEEENLKQKMHEIQKKIMGGK